jgi:hypothetical protein
MNTEDIMEDRLKYESEDEDNNYEEDDNYNNNDEFCDDEYEEVNRSSGKSRKKMYEDLKNNDIGYFSISKNIKGKNYKIEMYNSGVTIGNKIRDAITGNYYNYKIGSKY